MKATAHVDTGQGKVYRLPFPTLAAARGLARGPYHLGDRVVVVSGRTVECYERGRALRARPVQS